MSLRTKINGIVQKTLPEDTKYTLLMSKSGIGDTSIVTIITSAWKSLPVFVRVLRIQKALQESLAPEEWEKILRVSVFVPETLQRFLKSPTPARPAWAKIA